MIPLDYEPTSKVPPRSPRPWWVRLAVRIFNPEPFMMDGRPPAELSPRDRAELRRLIEEMPDEESR